MKYGIYISIAATCIAALAVGIIAFQPKRIQIQSIGAVKVADLKPDEASAKLKQWWNIRADLPFEWISDKPLPAGVADITPRKLGIFPDLDTTINNALYASAEIKSVDGLQPPLPIVWKIDVNKAKKTLAPFASINTEPVSAEISFANGGILRKKEKMGLKFDFDGTVAEIKKALDNNYIDAKLVFQEQKPKITLEDLKEITGVVSSFSTRFPARQYDRNHNIYKAASAINNIVLLPGETFSYNEIVGPRTSRDGFKLAPVLINGKKKLGVGGGICQVSSTLYNAALMADLKIVSRSRHAIPSSYIAAGRDATVNYGTIDLKFNNNTEKPIAISTTYAKGSITVRILGEPKPEREVKIIVANNKYIPATVKTVKDPTLPVGKSKIIEKGHAGRRCTTWRYVYVNGELVRKEKLSTDYYRPQTKIIAVGAKPTAETQQNKPAQLNIQPEEGA